MTGWTASVLAEGSFWMPQAASSIAGDVDALYYFILWLCVFFFILVMGAMFAFVWKYRRQRSDQRTHPIAGNRTLEIVWSVIPSLILVVLFVWGTRVWLEQTVPPPNAMEIRVTGQMWNWSYDYPTKGCTGATELVVPKDTPVKLIVNSTDVLHSFYIPAFRVKRDAVPNKYNVMWFEAIEAGEFDIFCAEYCGDQHSQMLSKVRVVSNEAFQEWVDAGCGMGGEGMAPAEFGAMLYDKKGCKTCHSVDGTRLVGPSFQGLYGRKEKIKDGSEVDVDDNYLRESIMYPNAKIVAGYDGVMPSYKGKLKDKQVDAIIDYIKSLSQ
jgi:cytochrome c oxidase subunit 2